jgi:hypothetical protein
MKSDIKITIMKRKSRSLTTCSGAGYNLKKSPSRGVKSAAGRRLTKCKTKRRKKTGKRKTRKKSR